MLGTLCSGGAGLAGAGMVEIHMPMGPHEIWRCPDDSGPVAQLFMLVRLCSGTAICFICFQQSGHAVGAARGHRVADSVA